MQGFPHNINVGNMGWSYEKGDGAASNKRKGSPKYKCMAKED